MTAAVVFAVAFGAFAAGHQIADYWVQTPGQSVRKALPGWTGRRACLAHVATYHLTLAAFLALAAGVLAVPVSPGKAGFWDAGEGLASGAAHLDQSWHWLWIFAAALITAGGIR